jgi:hypothetical protein
MARLPADDKPVSYTVAARCSSFREVVGSASTWPAHLWTERIAMTAPRAPQWSLTPALRLAALALLFAGAALLVQGWFSTALWLGSVVLLVLAIVKFAKNWKSRS